MMSINMNKFKKPYKIETLLNQSEIEKRLASQIAVKIILMRLTEDGFLSLDREIKDGQFRISIRMWKLPANWRPFFLPKIVGEIVEAEDDTSSVLMWLEVSIIDLLIMLAIYTCVCFFMHVSVFIYVLILCLAVALITIYWQSTRKRFGKRLEMLLKAESQGKGRKEQAGKLNVLPDRREKILSDLAFRRVAAFIIDYYILSFVFTFVCMCGVILVILQTKSIRIEDINKIFEIETRIVFYSIRFFFTWIYFFLLDYWENIDVGKKLTRIELLSDNQKLTVNKKLKHSILKCIFMVIWPISIIYYLVRQEMIYDKYLKISISMKV